LLDTGMTDYVKTGPNSNFEFGKPNIGVMVGITGLPISMTDKLIPKPVNQPTHNCS
jgi:hypothetical protein